MGGSKSIVSENYTHSTRRQPWPQEQERRV